jgi:hypothetical protein
MAAANEERASAGEDAERQGVDIRVGSEHAMAVTTRR